MKTLKSNITSALSLLREITSYKPVVPKVGGSAPLGAVERSWGGGEAKGAVGGATGWH